MAVSPEIQDLIDNPIETLHVELKSWLDLMDQTVRAKTARHLAAVPTNNPSGLILLAFSAGRTNL
jgi:hypothetical protein